MRAACLIALLAVVVRASAQDPVPGNDDAQSATRDLIEQRIEAVVEQLGDNADVDLTALTEILQARLRDPIELNNTSIDELAQLQLLSDVQISGLIDHRQRFGKLMSFYELQTIDAFDPRTIQLIRPFVHVSDNPRATRASLKEIFKNGTNEVLVRTVMNIEQRKGYIGTDNIFGTTYVDPDDDALPDVSDAEILDSLRANSKVYLGAPYKLYARYKFKYRQNVSFGVTAEKDEGEEFFSGTQPDGFDFYSAHLFLRDVGPVKALALGDYQAQFGQGLTFWNGLAYSGKSAFTMNIKRNAPGLSPYASVNENLFLRGVAATVEPIRHVEITGFFSSKGYDANVKDPVDPNTENADAEATFSSLLDDGYHRTHNELEKKDAITETIYGGHLTYKRSTWNVGATMATADFGRALLRDVKPYNQFEFQGQRNTTYGFDWNVLHRNLTWFGEAARSENGGMGLLSGALIALDKRLSLSLLYRDYQRNYQGLYSVAFAESTHPWNERGLYMGIEVKPDRVWTINAYMDQFRFPWMRYLTDAPSSGYDILCQVTYKPSKRAEIYGRVRTQHRQRNAEGISERVDPLVDVVQTNYRFHASYRATDAVTLRTRVESINYQRGDAPKEHGFLIYQDVIHRPMRSRIELTGRVALFSTDSYDARVYAYENDVIGLFSIPPYYGKGMRWYAMVRYSPLRRVDVWVRYGAWIYNDQDRISSGLEESNGNRKSDLKVELRVQF